MSIFDSKKVHILISNRNFIDTLSYILILLSLIQSGYFIITYQLMHSEALEIEELKYGFLDLFNFLIQEKNTIWDRGATFPLLLRTYLPWAQGEIALIRVLSATFFVLSLVLIIKTSVLTKNTWARLFVALLLILNPYFYYYMNMVNPYSLSFLSVLICYPVYRGLMQNPRSLSLQIWACGLSSFAVITFYVAALPVTVFYGLFFYKHWRDIHYKSLTILALFISFVPKGIMVFKFRFMERVGNYTPYSSFVEDSFWTALHLFGFMHPANFYYSVIGLVVPVFIALSFLFYKNKKNPFNIYTDICLICMVFFLFLTKKLDLHEIEGRYFFALLPLFYLRLYNYLIELKSELLKTILLICIIVTTSINFFFQFRKIDFYPTTSVADFFIKNIKAGDIVCYPEENGRSYKIGDAVFHYRGVKTIDGLDSESYFNCRELFLERLPLTHQRIWIVLLYRDEFQGCIEGVPVFDCDYEYSKNQLLNYREVDRVLIEDPQHSRTTIYLYERNN